MDSTINSLSQKEPPCVAWQVEEEDGQEKVIFHVSKEGALNLACVRFKFDPQYTDPPKRVSAFDHYAELGYVPAAELIIRGWWLHCVNCDQPLYIHRLKKSKLRELEFDRDNVWCSQRCRRKYESHINHFQG
ncbi:hypothetical protein KCM76_25625 [Zooshikella marina]|uniref:hypothetical protein n=1 Tax=Zooshikella ganghwensis TaxID=202772 RepID=UPI001BAEFAE3|nr:hypothetical protein [Zooshikella ganghwensis]MBU2709397.1 hypothetical protein [Zooshikella ganghwensis]